MHVVSRDCPSKAEQILGDIQERFGKGFGERFRERFRERFGGKVQGKVQMGFGRCLGEVEKGMD